MQCPNCGAELPDDSIICTECYYEIEYIEEICLEHGLNIPSDNKNSAKKNSHIGIYVAIFIPLFIIASFCTFVLGYADGDIGEAIGIVRDTIVPGDEAALVEKGFLSVRITIPASISESNSAGEALVNDIAKMDVVELVTKNKDGSVTVKTQRKAYNNLLTSISSAINKKIKDVVNDTNSSVMTIDHNDNITAFDISVDTAFLSESEESVIIDLFTLGDIYQIFNGIDEKKVKTVANLIDYDSKEVLTSFNSTAPKDVDFKSYVKIPVLESQSKESPPTQSFAASYMPAKGAYINSTNGGFPHTCEIRVKKKSDNSFTFSIWEIIDENGNGCNNIIFMENVAVFDSADSTTAVYYGQTYTVYFDCSQPCTIKLSGFEQATVLSDKYLNIDAMERAAGMLP